MRKYNAITLVEGTYDVEEVKEILLNLLNDKIKFHQLKKFSNHEKNGEEDQQSIDRLSQLKVSYEKLVEFLANQEHSGKKFRLKSEVFLEEING